MSTTHSVGETTLPWCALPYKQSISPPPLSSSPPSPSPYLLRAVGAVIGFAMVWGGSDAIDWDGRTANFPYYTGMQ